MIFDTCFIIDLLKGDNNAVSYLENLERTSKSKIITAITIHELWRGLGILNIKEKEEIKEILQTITVLPLDLESAKASGEIERKLLGESITIDPEDAMIAGIAIKNNQKLLTKNLKHFFRIKGLKISIIRIYYIFNLPKVLYLLMSVNIQRVGRVNWIL